MKRLFYFIAISTTLLLVSCSNDEYNEIIPEAKTYTPKIEAAMGQLTDINPQLTTRAGVVEDNPDYALGEKFYWHNGDKAKVLFFPNGDLSSEPTELIYTATVADGVKSANCQFSTTGSVPAGNYKVYALYPADGWSKDVAGYKATFPYYGILNYIVYYNASSTHLKDYMFMKADAGNVTISGTVDNSINLNFKHLTSLVRIHITSDYDAETLTTYGALELSEKSDNKFFNSSIYLNSIDRMDISGISDSQTSLMAILSVNKLPYIKKGSTWSFDYFIPVLPTTVNTANTKLCISTTIHINETTTFQQYFNTYNGLSFANELSFMPNGFEAGKSYYFNLKADIW